MLLEAADTAAPTILGYDPRRAVRSHQDFDVQPFNDHSTRRTTFRVTGSCVSRSTTVNGQK